MKGKGEGSYKKTQRKDTKDAQEIQEDDTPQGGVSSILPGNGDGEGEVPKSFKSSSFQKCGSPKVGGNNFVKKEKHKEKKSFLPGKGDEKGDGKEEAWGEVEHAQGGTPEPNENAYGPPSRQPKNEPSRQPTRVQGTARSMRSKTPQKGGNAAGRAKAQERIQRKRAMKVTKNKFSNRSPPLKIPPKPQKEKKLFLRVGRLSVPQG